MSEGFSEEVEGSFDGESYVFVEVLQRDKDTHGSDGYMRVQSCNGLPEGHNVYLDIDTSKKLRKALKRAEKFLES